MFDKGGKEVGVVVSWVGHSSLLDGGFHGLHFTLWTGFAG